MRSTPTHLPVHACPLACSLPALRGEFSNHRRGCWLRQGRRNMRSRPRCSTIWRCVAGAASGGLSRRQDTAPPETALVSRLLRSSNISPGFVFAAYTKSTRPLYSVNTRRGRDFPLRRLQARACASAVFSRWATATYAATRAPADGRQRRLVRCAAACHRARAAAVPAAAAAASTQSAAVAAATATPAAASAPQCTRALLRTAAPVAARRCL